LCEHLPLLAQQAHHISVVNSVGGSVNTNDHHAGYYYNLTGHVPDRTFLTQGNDRKPYADDWPYMGTVVASRRKQHPYLTNAITLPHKEGAPRYTRPGQFSARLGVEYDPLYVHGEPEKPTQFQAPSLTLTGDITAARMTQRQTLVRSIDAARRQLDGHANIQTWQQQQERALSLLTSSRTAEAFDLSKEPENVRERYGNTLN
ncbi:MAG: DUF1501 domain-containing protein, partial [Fuerstiella sp.]|nr:DUF1501 domain-containing protein [Fuerstiella sp.]